MKYSLQISMDMVRDLENLNDYLTQYFSVEVAKKSLQVIVDAYQLLAEFPNRGFVIRELTSLMLIYYRLILPRNVIFYTVNSSERVVSLQRLFSHKQDMMKIFKDWLNVQDRLDGFRS